MTKSIKIQKDQFQISIKPLYQSQKNFVFNNKSFPFDFELFKNNSSFFFKYKNQYENIESFNILNDDEIKYFKNITDSAISDFISLCQNEKCQIKSSDIFYILYLSYKFEVKELTKSLTDLISNNFKIIEDKSFLKNNSDAFFFFSEEFTDIYSRNLMKFINNDNTLDLPVCIVHQILHKYFLQINNQCRTSQTELKENITNDNNLIVEFLFKYLQKHKKDASILFSLINFQNDKYRSIIQKLLNDYQDVFDFGMIGNIIQKCALNAEHNDAKLKKIFALLETSQSFEVKEKQEGHTNKEINNQKLNISQIKPDFQNENSSLFLQFSNIILIENP